MACYKFSSCTAGNATILWSTDPAWAPYVGGPAISFSNHGGNTVAYTVEEVLAPCSCGGVNNPLVNPSFLIASLGCNSPNSCYKLMECNNAIPPVYVSNNLNPYIGTSISVAEYPGRCFNIVGIANFMECADNSPIVVTCIQNCVCGIHCYQLTNCGNPLEIITVNSTLIITLGDVIFPTPSIIPSGGNNCWTVTAVNIEPCDADTGTTITAFSNYFLNGCVACAGPPPCFKLTSCDGLTVVYSQSDLRPYAGGPPIATSVFPGQCFIVTLLAGGEVCTTPRAIDPLTITSCICVCYTLTNCRTRATINSNSNLAAYVGNNVHINPPNDIGCSGDCWQVSINSGLCTAPTAVTVSQDCNVCEPCNATCYEIVDCQTNVLFTTALNPTANAVDLSTLISGQSIGQISIGGIVTNGCWYVRLAIDCGSAVTVSVFNIYQPNTQGQTGCQQCLNSCYGLLNCKTLVIDKIIKYTAPNANPLIPNPNTLIGALGSLCFTVPSGGCLPGCYQLQLIPGAACAGSVDWTTVVSYTSYQDCSDCQPSCYLLTECAPAISTPIVVNNDLSLYVGQIAKICDSLGECHCYNVEISQSCDGAITIDNANASFTTCDECNSCACPPGYTKIGDNCQKITTVPAIANPIIYSTAPGSISNLYGNLGTNFYSNISALPYPITAIGSLFKDAALVVVPSVNNIIGVWNGPAGSRLNTVGIWTTVAPNPVNEWIGFSECINIPTNDVYCIGIGGDDAVRIRIDGVLIVLAASGVFDFNYWHVFEINLTAGTHVITLEGINTGGVSAFAAEIYNVNSATLQTYTTVAQVQLATIFSTFDKRKGGTFQTGETSGFSCPTGYTLNTCGRAFSCSLIETVPFVECPRTFLVTSCEPGLAPFYTNTDLSAYTQSVYKTCIPQIIYSTSCFILKDCNRLVADIVTNTVLTGYLWQTVSLQGFPGSCFIVTGVVAGEPCVGAVPVIILDGVSCICKGAQQPWPAGCYCVTVKEIIPTIVAPDFEGAFISIKPYDCCLDCTRTCYILTSCVGGINPVIVCNDLAQYVGKVIKIASCGDICWQVAVSSNCNGSITFAGEITPFVNCNACLPPLPPTPPPYDLHLRKIKPGWKSPNSCYTLDYIERINCTFGQQIYNEMLVARYGITVCCEEDVNKWDIKKQMLDLDMLKDPNLCKSTLCCCPAPCFIEAFVTVLPFCGVPNIVSVVFNLPCPAPVLIDVEIEVLSEPAVCRCFSVEVLDEPVSISYIDCCCVVQTQVIDAIGIYPICSSTAPVSINNPLSIVVTDSGLCGVSPLCNPPPFQVCSCWSIYNPTVATLGFSIAAICPAGPDPVELTGTVAPLVTIYNCSVAPPVVATGLIVTNTGNCGTYCGPIPAVCVCYVIEATETCIVDYTDCNGFPVVGSPIQVGTTYICANSIPIVDAICSQFITINVTAADCNLRECQAPVVPCICYTVTVPSDGNTHYVDIVDCNGVPDEQTYAIGGVYYTCSQTPPTSDSGVIIGPTALGCGPGQCVEP